MSDAPQTADLQLNRDEGAQQLAEYRPGDVFQINEQHGRLGWIGSFVLAEEIRTWGIQGFVVAIQTHDKQERAYIRLKWEEIDYIGHAKLVPQDLSLVDDNGRTENQTEEAT